MKIKCRPEDFRVEEIIRLALKPKGQYSIYRLEKRYWNTLDLIHRLKYRYGLKNLSRAGLKDRYSHSIQYLSLLGKGPKKIAEDNYSLLLVGMADEPVTRDVLVGNRFNIIIRSLNETEIETLKHSLTTVKRFGFSNYYDEQRLGSARHGKGFIARKLIEGHYNGALKLFLATPSADDDSNAKKRKRLLALNWGNWEKCYEFAPFEGKPIFQYLREHPRDFLGAVQLIPKSLLELFINAYQSWLWNEVMATLLMEMGLGKITVPYGFGKLIFYESLSSEEVKYLTRLVIPAPAPKAEFKSERVARITNEVLQKEDLELKQLKLKFRIKGVFFKPYERAAIVFPRHLKVGALEPDELYPKKSKLTLSFILPSGSYATILIKRLCASSPQ